jgi:alpha-galactosidase
MEAKDFSQPKISCAHRVLPRRARIQSHATWMNYRRPVLILAVATAFGAPAFAAQTDITISTAAAPATPRINGATVIGATPGSPFLHTISATGQAPLTFSATGLPAGLSIAANSGTISGTTPAAGPYSINVTVTNSAGSATGTLTLNAGSTLALTPPMGWNSYDSFYEKVTEKDVVAAAQAMKTLLQPYGWNTAVIDYLWYDPEQTIDANGRWLPSKSKYPSATGSDGFKSLATQVHGLGLSFGIHLMRGIPRKTVTANSPILNSTSTASQAGNTGDTCSWDSHMYGVRADTAAGKAWYDSIYTQYADWGVDFVKVDDMMNPYGTGQPLHSTEVEAVHASIVKTGRTIILSLSPGPTQTRDVAVLNANANMWRQVNDFWDTNGLSTIGNEFDAANSWANTSGITPGHWPDADMLPLGTIGSRACAFSHNQQVTVMSLWAIMPSPLMFGGMMTKLSTDSWTLALLTNEEVLAVNQDALGARGKRVAQQGTTEVWAKDMSGGRKAVALFNRGTQDATVSVTFSQLGVTGTPPVRDLWHRADVTGMTSGISVNVPHEAALMYTVGGGTGAGGSGGAGGSTGAGGSGAGGGSGSGGVAGGNSGGAGRGGTVASAGTTGGGGTTGEGGARGGTTGAGGAGSGGVTGRGGATGGGTGGATASGGAGSGGTTAQGGAPAGGSGGSAGSAIASGGSTATASSSSGVGTAPGTGGAAGGSSGSGPAGQSGCSCSVGSHSRSSAWWILVFAAATVVFQTRHRRSVRRQRST